MFERFSYFAVRLLSSPILFAMSWAGVLVWLALGPSFHYSTAWQFAMNQPLTIGSWLASIITLFAADKIQHKQDELAEVERERQQHIEQMTQRMEQQNLAIISWLRYLAEEQQWHPSE